MKVFPALKEPFHQNRMKVFPALKGPFRQPRPQAWEPDR